MKRILILLFSFISFNGMAQIPQQAVMSFAVGAGYSAGENSRGVENDKAAVSYDGSYRFQLLPEWGIELGYKRLDPQLYTVHVEEVLDNEIIQEHIYSYRALATYSIPFMDKQRFDLKAGVHQYDLGYRSKVDGKIVVKDKSAMSYYAAANWVYRFDIGIELGVGYDFQQIDVIRVQTFSLVIGYSI
ncbi:outer membrane beta-barrel protein [Parashewanella tropica]|uniref:outer membrane beta-barrel protein n=1 Tax=Parashewanella tropica TaxID=2547970 RepID=UPI001059D944|nr:outer membrane beta-barrel protein [Parashewanella tropica]